jgi:hypothetical protein
MGSKPCYWRLIANPLESSRGANSVASHFQKWRPRYLRHPGCRNHRVIRLPDDIEGGAGPCTGGRRPDREDPGKYIYSLQNACFYGLMSRSTPPLIGPQPGDRADSSNPRPADRDSRSRVFLTAPANDLKSPECLTGFGRRFLMQYSPMHPPA